MQRVRVEVDVFHPPHRKLDAVFTECAMEQLQSRSDDLDFWRLLPTVEQDKALVSILNKMYVGGRSRTVTFASTSSHVCGSCTVSVRSVWPPFRNDVIARKLLSR